MKREFETKGTIEINGIDVGHLVKTLSKLDENGRIIKIAIINPALGQESEPPVTAVVRA